MKFRLGLLIGGAIGYVLGSRAGRERYEQIVSQWEQLRAHPKVQEISGQVSTVADNGRRVVSSGLREGSNKLRQATNDTDEPPGVGI